MLSSQKKKMQQLFSSPVPKENVLNATMTLAAAERARKASERCIEQINQYIPDTSSKRNLVQSVNEKLELLKRDVAYLILQNFSLIDKLLDAEKTMSQVRKLNEINKNINGRPRTIAADDILITRSSYDISSRAAKCESCCEPLLKLVQFDEIEKHAKLSPRNRFVSESLREYINKENLLSDNFNASLYEDIIFDLNDSGNDSRHGDDNIVSLDDLYDSEAVNKVQNKDRTIPDQHDDRNYDISGKEAKTDEDEKHNHNGISENHLTEIKQKIMVGMTKLSGNRFITNSSDSLHLQSHGDEIDVEIETDDVKAVAEVEKKQIHSPLLRLTAYPSDSLCSYS